MTDRPIIFSAPMVRALLDGRTGERGKIYPRQHQDPSSPDQLARRLANGLDFAPDEGCWEWKRHRNQYGYGSLTVEGRTIYAHILAYKLGNGPIPDGLHVLHKCDNPRCINPAHLEVGTRSKNMADCHARGRSRIPPTRKRGESNGSAKLTAEKVSIIRDGLAAGVTQRQLADRFGVSQTLISRINRQEIWND